MTWDIRSADFFQDVAVGKIPGMSFVEKYGENNVIDTASTPETIWQVGGKYVWPTVASPLTIVSADANDTLGGTGAHSVALSVLDENWLEKLVIVELDGLTPVVVPDVLAFRLNRARIVNAGTGGTNLGAITVTGGGITYGSIPPLTGSTLQAVFTVPKNSRAFLKSVWASLRRPGPTGAAQCTVRLEFRSRPDLPNPPGYTRFNFYLALDGASYISHEFEPALDAFGPIDIQMVVTDVSDNGEQISAGFTLLYGNFNGKG